VWHGQIDPKLIRMVRTIRITGALVTICTGVQTCVGQGLSPRAYCNHTNPFRRCHADVFVSGRKHCVRPDAPDFRCPRANQYRDRQLLHTPAFLGRSANVSVSLPYSTGRFQGTISGVEGEIYRSGLAPSIFRLSVNLRGGPAMKFNEFVKWKQKTVLGASVTVDAQTGQYDPARLFNIGANRWSFKPELGFSRRWGGWIFDAYGAVWFLRRPATTIRMPMVHPRGTGKRKSQWALRRRT
jgi:hypothetical protein